ncbi:hypothetical protein JG687_00011131 [Phytophthora cactorum]|uniref:DDE-1 domain-containing protein n=1 Tax=Phytophthora cactorum TaxID=29920 RepID=A0A8T1U5G6_9STRA|nr:hypothetical protein JG687_00011131 [Phytophthora cactorum]
MKRFKMRNKLSMRARTRQGQKSPEDLDKIAAEFSKDVAEKVQVLGIKTIYNADQTAVFFEYLPARTISRKGEKTVWVRCGGKSKERTTVMLLADSNGKKMAPFVVFKTDPSKNQSMREQNPRFRHVQLWKTINQIQANSSLQVYGNRKGICLYFYLFLQVFRELILILLYVRVVG